MDSLMPVTNNSLIGVRPWAISLAVPSINPKQFCNGAPVWATALSYLCSASGSIDCKTVRIFAYSSTREQSNKRSGILMSSYATLYRFFCWFWGKTDCFAVYVESRLPGASKREMNGMFSWFYRRLMLSFLGSFPCVTRSWKRIQERDIFTTLTVW